ncbi:translocation/assembly module TamB domain-containing protein [Solitalea lacus]|uniref:translocation/assembly module TamB domain-containing protein n=1 Tax=Solitalea lacus TaxID=2911172 RepID=UPI001EDB93EB|nr:translocation/assembly module TamB domain-containing protein [Solitalea lacus]UKJ08498.1 translocation/assembly module TamB [Solitalea lacus]
MVIILLVVLYFAGQTKWFQTKAAQYGAEYLTKELKTRVEIKGLYIKFVKSVVIEGLYIEDLRKDTLLYSGLIEIDLNKLNIKGRKILVDDLKLYDAHFAYKDFKNNTSNLSFLINYFSGTPDTTKKVPTKPFEFWVNSIDIKNLTFIYFDEKNAGKARGMDYADIRASKVNLQAENVSIDGDVILADLKNLSANEKCGFVLNKLAGRVKYTPKEIEINNLKIITPNSRISKYLAFRYKKISDFNDFVDKVYMDANFSKTHVDFKDIAYFAPAIKNYTLEVDLDGMIKGTVTDLRTKNVTFRAGNETLIKGNIAVKGLPDINKTDFDLEFAQLQTNRDDINRILASVDQKEAELPEVLKTVGNVNFKGTFIGQYNNFKVKGALVTATGTALTDLAMDLRNMKKPLYKGFANAQDLDLGKLTGVKSLGKTSFVANVDGHGFSIDNLKEDLNAKIAYFDYNGYRYQNVSISGKLEQKKFNGAFDINDKNIAIDFDGRLNLSGKRPIYDFTADVKHADFRAIKLMNDTLAVSTYITSDFSGANIDNILGSLTFANTNLKTKVGSFKIDSIQLTSVKRGDTAQALVLRSDMLDASFRGKYSLTQLEGATKGLLSSYLPSFKWKQLKAPVPQNFDFEIAIKDVKPITSIFLPDLKIEDGGRFMGNFNSAKNQITINGSIEKLQYQKFEIENLILDQGNSDESLFLNIALGTLEVDSLKFNDVAMSNYVKNDRVTSNLKVTDPAQMNSIDLNSEIRFTADSTIFSVLPSELKLNNESWKIDDKFRILFAKEGYLVEDFTLRNNDQTLEVHGAISKKDDEALIVNLRNLNLNILNPFLKGEGLVVGGYVTGNASTSAVLKAPKVGSDMIIHELSLNNNMLGDAEISSRWYSETNDINFSINVTRDNLNTISVSGNVLPNKKEDNLFADIELNETSLVIFQPFLTGLVSDLTGKTSANILVRGSILKPQLNGNIAFNNAGVRVDYLNTRYTINDKVGIENGKILFDNFILTDVKKNRGTANGILDLSDLNNVKLDLRLNATRFQALNTTFKDNQLYYGTAYASGNFLFKGTLDNMAITINATTTEGTKFFLPISSESSIGSDDLVAFVTRDTISTKNIKEKKEMALQLNFDLTVNPTAEVSILLGENSGGTMTGKGNGSLQLRINTLGDFRMFGLYTLTEGKYNMSIPGVKEEFIINNGSTVRFNGDPYEARMNVSAYFPTRASLTNLYTEARIQESTEKMNQKIIVNTIINVTGSLTDMAYDFKIEFPQNESLYQNTFASYFSGEGNVQKQAFGLLSTGGFTTESGLGIGGGAIAGSMVDLVSSKLSNLLNEAIGSQNFDINANVSATGETEVGGNVRLLNQRLIINGSFTSRDKNTTGTTMSTNNSSALSSDIDIEYLIFPDGSLRLKAYNHSNTTNNSDFFYDSEYKQGIGVLYRKDFDSWREFFENTRKKERQRELRRQQRAEERKKELEEKEKQEKEKKEQEEKNKQQVDDNSDSEPVEFE